MNTATPSKRLNLALAALSALWGVRGAKRPPTPPCNSLQQGLGIAAANSGERGAFSGILAANDAYPVQISTQDGLHAMFLPFGEHPVTVKDPKSGRSVPAVQVFNQESGAALIETMASTTGKAALRLGAIPIKVGHPDVPELAHMFSDTKSYGRVVAANLATRDGSDGLELAVKFNPSGLKLIEEDAYRFYSPFWTLRKLHVANGVIYAAPAALISVGLTDTPNMPVPAISAANMEELIGEPAPETLPPPPPSPPSLLDRLAALLGLSGEDEIIAKVAELHSAATAMLSAHAQEQAAQEAKYKALEEAHIATANSVTGLTAQVDQLRADLNTAMEKAIAADQTLAAANADLAAAQSALVTQQNAAASDRASCERMQIDLADVRAQLSASNTARQESDARLLAANADVTVRPVLEGRLQQLEEAFVNLAIESGRVLGGRKKDVLAAFNTDFSGALALVSESEQVVPLHSQTRELGRRRPGAEPVDEYLEAVNCYMQRTGCSNFEEAWYAVARQRRGLAAALRAG